MLCCIIPLSLGHLWVPARLPLIARFSLEVSRWILHKSEDLYLLTYFPVPSGPGPVCYAVEAAVDVTGRVFGVFGDTVYAYRDALLHWSHGYAAKASLGLCARDLLDFESIVRVFAA